jgi:hypothetical protein
MLAMASGNPQELIFRGQGKLTSCENDMEKYTVILDIWKREH